MKCWTIDKIVLTKQISEIMKTWGEAFLLGKKLYSRTNVKGSIVGIRKEPHYPRKPSIVEKGNDQRNWGRFRWKFFQLCWTDASANAIHILNWVFSYEEIAINKANYFGYLLFGGKVLRLGRKLLWLGLWYLKRYLTLPVLWDCLLIANV